MERNTDNKIVAGSYAEAASGTFAKNISSSQRAYTKNRNFAQNVVDLDAKARIFGLFPELLPILLFFDFRTAFPSIEHCFLFAVWVRQCH